MKIAKVKWLTSMIRQNWTPIKQCPNELTMVTNHSIGFVIAENDERIILAQTYYSEQAQHTLLIPKNNIIELKTFVEAPTGFKERFPGLEPGRFVSETDSGTDDLGGDKK